jgi:hypothetical protein
MKNINDKFCSKIRRQINEKLNEQLHSQLTPQLYFSLNRQIYWKLWSSLIDLPTNDKLNNI